MFRWSLIAGRLPGRTDNEIKNYWNTHIRRKLLNRGIDPATHRVINDPAPEVTTISFATNTKEEEEKITYENRENNCPDLNLELKISPPCPNPKPEPFKTGESNSRSSLCFSCSLGIQNSKECSCTNGTSSSSTGYDFLGLKSGLLDYRSLEMKWASFVVFFWIV